MARTLNPTAHAVRREAFVDAGQRLIQTKGYEQMSVQDVLDQVDASRGAFYHYFDSKAALLEAVISQLIDGALGSIAPLLADEAASAPVKIQGLFGGIATWKNARREFLLSLLQTWLSDDNAIVREKFRREVVRRMTPLLADVIAQGVAEGLFATRSPVHTARVFLALVLGANEEASRLFVARQANTVSFDEIRSSLDAYGEGFERILGARTGSLSFVGDATLHLWYD